MGCSTPGFPVHHQLPELTQTHVDRVGDGILSSHPLSLPFPPTLNLSQYQGLFQGVDSASGGHSIRASMDRGAWWAIVYGVTKNGTRLSDEYKQ